MTAEEYKNATPEKQEELIKAKVEQKLLNEKKFLVDDDEMKNEMHLQFEISIAWDDDDEYEHEGYYNSVDDAIEALLKYKK